MIAITGAGGKTGLALLEALAKRGVATRGLVHKATDQAAITAAGAVESVMGKIEMHSAIEALLRGVDAVYHICPNMHPDEVAIGATLIACAQAAGVKHLVYHSVLHPHVAAMPHHWHKLLVEEQIFASGIPFTVLQPTAYMQNLLGYWKSIRQTGLYAVPYPVTTRLSLVDLKDVAVVWSVAASQTALRGCSKKDSMGEFAACCEANSVPEMFVGWVSLLCLSISHTLIVTLNISTEIL